MSDGPRFTVAPVAVIRDRELSDTAKVVAMEIGAHMDRRGNCFPGEAILARNTGYSTRTIRRCMVELVDRGHLWIKRRARLPSLLTWCEPMTGHLFVRSPTNMTGQTTRGDGTNDPPMMGHGVASHRPTTSGSETELTASSKDSTTEQPGEPRAPREPGEPLQDYYRRVIPGFGTRP